MATGNNSKARKSNRGRWREYPTIRGLFPFKYTEQLSRCPAGYHPIIPDLIVL
ncbi:hypothetical protein [Desulfobulbus propionicus]|uniref:hypothetical protein n=1 Tax=Desulfobulbus propionicus TaxID=894 RepID=UPI0002EC74CE|nr:hypothetical protein [Desulfobulbus propionicus]